MREVRPIEEETVLSKAFTRENDGDHSDESELPVPSGKNYMTPEGADRLREELKRLLTETRPEVVKVVSWAASNGDRSENGDYLYGKKRLREIDRRIRYLQKRLDAVEVVDQRGSTPEKVVFGIWVGIRYENGTVKRIRIVGFDETDPAQGYVSWQSPMARALLGLKIGDATTVRMPKGDEEVEIESIEAP